MEDGLHKTNQDNPPLSLVLPPKVSSLHTRSIASLAHSASHCLTARASCTLIPQTPQVETYVLLTIKADQYIQHRYLRALCGLGMTQET